jgi:endonuclease/exonuclease/phosphatase family metal-dependent hydrolase
MRAKKSCLAKSTVKIMTYNLLDGAAGQLGQVVAVVNAESPDVLVLNEANGFDQDDRLAEFAAATGFDHYHLEACGDGDDYHVAVLSKLPFKTVRALHPFARAGVLVTVETDLGEIALVGTHLTPYSEDGRVAEAKLIVEALKPYPMSIVMGDLNSLSPNDDYAAALPSFNDTQVKKFTAGGKLRFDTMTLFAENNFIDTATLFGKQGDITAPTSVTKDVAHSNMRLDYILVSPALKDRVSNYQVIKNQLTEVASDHYPVVAEIR